MTHLTILKCLFRFSSSHLCVIAEQATLLQSLNPPIVNDEVVFVNLTISFYRMAQRTYYTFRLMS